MIKSIATENNYPFRTNHPRAEYFAACCPECMAASQIIEGHSQCSDEAVKMKANMWKKLEEPVLTQVGWMVPMLPPFHDCEVEATSIEDFMLRYYRPERYHGRDDWFKDVVYSDVLLASHRKHLEERGWDIISLHDSVTGKVVCYRPR